MIRRRGAILLEVVLSIVLFVGAASFCLAATRSLFEALDRADRRDLALDLARSKLAELEAGLVTLGELRGEWSGAVGSRLEDDDLELDEDEPRWSIDATTSRSPFSGLSLVELTVTELTGVLEVDENRPATTITLRQLVVLREIDAEAYEVDEMLEGLPEASLIPGVEP
jgi:hypothetical protein